MPRLCRGFFLVVLSTCVIQAEWFDKGKVAYKTLDRKWRKAAIHVTDEGIEVYERKNRSLVARISDLNPRRHHYPRERFSLKGALFGGSGIGILAVSSLATKVELGYVTDCNIYEYSSSCTTRWSEGRDAVITAQTAWKTIGVISAVTATVAAITLRPIPTEYTFSDWPRSIRVRVGNGNQKRFNNVLKLRRSRDRAHRQPGSGVQEVAEPVLFRGGGRERPRGGEDPQKSAVRHHSDGLPQARDQKLPKPTRGLEQAPSTESLSSLFTRQVYRSQPGS